jgi:hypothetical protein
VRRLLSYNLSNILIPLLVVPLHINWDTYTPIFLISGVF